MYVHACNPVYMHGATSPSLILIRSCIHYICTFHSKMHKFSFNNAWHPCMVCACMSTTYKTNLVYTYNTVGAGF